MGSAQSYISTETTAVTLVIAGAAALAYGYVHFDAQTTSQATKPGSASVSDKKKNKKAASADKQGAFSSQAASTAASPIVVQFPLVIPGDFDSQPVLPEGEPPTERTKPKKKKKGKKAATPVGGVPRVAPDDALSESSATAPESHVSILPRPSLSKTKRNSVSKAHAAPSPDDETTWTRVDSRRRSATQQLLKAEGPAGVEKPPEVSTSDVGVTTTSVTGNSSSVAEHSEDELDSRLGPSSENRRTLAEKLLPKPRKTGVDDMLETPDYPSIARVMRIQPGPNDRPATGFSWGDYEDVDDSRGTADDADGEDDGGWGVVKSRARSKLNKIPSQQTPAQTAPESLTKKQRQNAAKRDAQNAAKAEAEAERQARLAKHKRELEHTKIAEHYGKSSKTASGGMTAYVDENGKLVWK
ncbi:hypothetical protein AcW2_005759 [Taiwanofungus camphoratus]|nr:hypothetical protein AcW2_005759 [Antrodia cinnamomea]